jgi:hypothetical protein
VPHVFATAKTQTATLLALPAMFLLLGSLIDAAWRGERVPLAITTGMMALAVFNPGPVPEWAGAVFPIPPRGDAALPIADMRWLAESFAGTAAIALGVFGLTGRASPRVLNIALRALVCVLVVATAASTAIALWQVTEIKSWLPPLAGTEALEHPHSKRSAR